MKRKVIKQGNGTLTITLPKKWTEEIGLKGGEEVNTEVLGKEIRISMPQEASVQSKTINIEGIESAAARMVSACYKQGYDEVRVFFSDNIAVKKIQDEVRNFLMTYEVVDQTDKSILIKSLATEHYEDFENVLRKAFQVGISMAKTSFDYVKAGEFDKLNDLIGLEFANNRFTSFCQRVIVKKGYSLPKKEVFIYTLIWQLEKVVDDYKYLIQSLSESKKKLDKETLALYSEANDIFESFYQLFYKYNASELDSFVKRRKALTAKCQEYMKDSKKNARVLHCLLDIIGDVFDMTGPYYALRL